MVPSEFRQPVLDDLHVGDCILLLQYMRPIPVMDAETEGSAKKVYIDTHELYGVPLLVRGIQLPFVAVETARTTSAPSHLLLDTRLGFRYVFATDEYLRAFPRQCD